MPRTFTVSRTVLVAAPPEQVYEEVSRPARMGRWSPENLGATVPGDADGTAFTGMTFDGHNRRGAMRWTTRCTVTAAEPGSRFAFRVHAIGLRRPLLRGPIATWEYRLAPHGEGTKVTETWTDDRRAWPDPVAAVFDRAVTGGRTFVAFQARNIDRTLRNLKRELERASRP
ncbi:SRPBCC family protein [Streptomyces sp. NPDC048172]|uniref:SRPBCC family protein n=1 Tax=Streptomyces sp. NPDC048172 TaxID=3365505 RepID=UPI003723D675